MFLVNSILTDLTSDEWPCHSSIVVLLVRQLEQQVKIILDSISSNEERKRGLIRGDAVDKAEQLSNIPAGCKL